MVNKHGVYLIFMLSNLLLFDCQINAQTNLPVNNKFGDSCIKIIERKQEINTIDQLVSLFRGKYVLLDIWATWCEPCLEEFKNSSKLFDYLNKHNVELIYISFDSIDRDELWRATIKKYKLSGNHILANKKLRDKISLSVWGAVDVFSIPYYLLYSKNGRAIDMKINFTDKNKKDLIDEIEYRIKN
jgi:thiol-disulfide isomerase/thioredoxin